MRYNLPQNNSILTPNQTTPKQIRPSNINIKTNDIGNHSICPVNANTPLVNKFYQEKDKISFFNIRYTKNEKAIESLIDKTKFAEDINHIFDILKIYYNQRKIYMDEKDKSEIFCSMYFFLIENFDNELKSNNLSRSMVTKTCNMLFTFSIRA